MASLSRRGFVGALGGCALCGGSAAAARVQPSAMQPLIGLSYAPSDADERGLWQSLERLEEELKTSNLLLDAPEMHDYVVGVGNRGKFLCGVSSQIGPGVIHTAGDSFWLRLG